MTDGDAPYDEPEPSGLLTLDEDEPTIRAEVLRAGAVAHEGRTEPGPREREATSGGDRDDRLRRIALRLLDALDAE